MWLFAVVAVGLPVGLYALPATRAVRSLWGQLAVVTLPVALLFASAMAGGSQPAIDHAARLLVLALSACFCCLFCLVRWLWLSRTLAMRPAPVHPALFLVLGGFAALSLLDIGVSPIWDAGLYFSSLLKAVNGFEYTLASFMSAFSAQSHLTQALITLYAPGQYLFPGSVVALNATTLVLGQLALGAFYRLVQKLLGDRGLAPVAATALLAFMPQVFAFGTGLNPDYGVFVGFVLLLYCFAYDRRVMSVAAALLVVFSKETGVLVYGGFGLGVILFAMLPPAVKKRSFAEFWRQAMRQWQYLLPLALFLLNFFGGSAGTLSSPGRLDSLVSGNAVGSFQFNFLHMVTVLNQIFLLNFNWVATLLVAAGLVAWVVKTVRAGQNPLAALLRVATARPVWGVLLTAAGVYLLFCLLYVDFPLARYNLATLVALPPCLMTALRQLPGKKAGRVLGRAAAPALLALYLVSSYWTVDPVSRFAFPYAHSMGGATLLEVTNHTGFRYVCERHIYNRQYLNYSRLFDDIAKHYGTHGAPYASYDVPEFAMQFFGNYERDYRLSYSPSLERRVFYAADGVPLPGRELFAEDAENHQDLPKQMNLIVLPYQNEETLAPLLRFYETGTATTFERCGLRMTVYACHYTNVE